LLLRLAAAQLRKQFAFRETTRRAFEWVEKNMGRGYQLATGGEAQAADLEDPDRRNEAFALSIGAGLTLLGEGERRGFFDVGVFPKDVEIPLATAGQLWGVEDPKELALSLADLALVDLQLGEHPFIKLHDVVAGYAGGRLRNEDRWATTHQRLVAAW